MEVVEGYVKSLPGTRELTFPIRGFGDHKLHIRHTAAWIEDYDRHLSNERRAIRYSRAVWILSAKREHVELLASSSLLTLAYDFVALGMPSPLPEYVPEEGAAHFSDGVGLGLVVKVLRDRGGSLDGTIEHDLRLSRAKNELLAAIELFNEQHSHNSSPGRAMASHAQSVKQLTKEQFRALYVAILSAFNEDNLRLLVRFHLNENLDEIVGAGSLSEKVYDLLVWAEKYGKVRTLLDAAKEENENNPELRAIRLT